MIRTILQNGQLHVLLNKLKIDAEGKAGMVSQYTNGRTDRSSKMTIDECQLLINQLNHDASPRNGESDKLRKKIISMCHEMGWELEGGKADMNRINQFCIKTGYLHKGLNDYQYDELVSWFNNSLSFIKTF